MSLQPFMPPSPAASPAPAPVTPQASKPSQSPASVIARSRAVAAAHAATASAALNTARGYAERAAAHPHAQRAIAVGKDQVERLRVVLANSETVMAVEGATGVDRVTVVAGGLALFILLVPLNLFGLAQTTTSALTLLLPAYKAFVVLENGGPTDNLLAYFVVLGYFQMLETFMLRLLVSQIPRYFTLKLAFMMYLAHPRLNGATKVYNLLFSRKLKSPPVTGPSSPVDDAVMTPNGLGKLAFNSPTSPTYNMSGSYGPMSPDDDVFTGGFQTRIPRPAGKFD